MQRDSLIQFCSDFSVKPALINTALEKLGTAPLKQGVKLRDLITRPELGIMVLAQHIEALQQQIESIEYSRRNEIVECAEILIKYEGYIERERMVAEKIKRLEDVKLEGRLDYSKITALSTEARMKLEKIKPVTVGQASRIPGISPSDISILLLLLGR